MPCIGHGFDVFLRLCAVATRHTILYLRDQWLWMYPSIQDSFTVTCKLTKPAPACTVTFELHPKGCSLPCACYTAEECWGAGPPPSVVENTTQGRVPQLAFDWGAYVTGGAQFSVVQPSSSTHAVELQIKCNKQQQQRYVFGIKAVLWL